MRTLTLFFLLVFGAVSPAMAQFTRLTQNTASGWWRVDDLTFSETDTRKGWAAISATGILRTLDAGHTWDTVLHLPQYYFRSVDFINENIGFAGSLDSLMFRTEDGGNTWTQYERSVFPASFAGICGMDHYNNLLYGVGTWAGSPFLVKTVDFGATWIIKDLGNVAQGLVDVTCMKRNYRNGASE